MDGSKVLAALDRERQELEVRGFRRIADPRLVRHVPVATRASGATAPHSGLVSYSRHSASDVDAAIDHVIAAFAELGCGFEWKVFEHDSPADLVSRLQRRGLSVGEEEQLMIMPIAAAEPLFGRRSVHRVERVTTPAGIADYLAVAAAVWTEEPGYVGWLQQELLETSRTALARFGFERLSASRPCRWSPG